MSEEIVKTDSFNDFIKSKFKDAVLNDGSFDKYTSVKVEYAALKHGVGIRNISNLYFLKMRGKEVMDFLHRVSTNDINSVKEFEHTNTLFLNEKGRFIDRAAYLRFAEYFMLIGSRVNGKKLHSWLDKYIIMEDINTEDFGGKFLLLEIAGPQADSYLTMICGDVYDKLDDKKIVNVDTDGFNFHIMKKKEVNGKYKYWLMANFYLSEKLVDYLLEQKSVFDVSMIGENAYNIYRIENGIPDAPNEINDNFNPHETGLTGEVNFTKGCYIGQEVIARLDTYDKVQKKIQGIVFENGVPEKFPISILDEEREIGSVTSADDSNVTEKNIGLAIIRNKYSEPGTQLSCKSDEGTNYNFTVTELLSGK